MKITFVTANLSLVGGDRTIAIYAGRLRDRGHEVRVICRLALPPTPRAIIRSLRQGGGWPRRGRPDATYLNRVGIAPRYVDTPGPVTDADVPDGDVVIATWWETAEWVARLSPSKGSKAYFLQDFEVFPFVPPGRVEATWRLPFQKIVVSQWLADLARTTFGDATVALVPNAVNPELFHAPPRGKHRVPTVGMIYALAERSRPGSPSRRTSWRPAGSPTSAWSCSASRTGLHELPVPAGVEIHVRPPQERLRELYASCDAWLFSSRTEGFGLPILEAMACRTPVIGTPAGAAPELIGQGGGFLVRPEDPADMAAAIERVVALTDDEWRTVSDSAYATATRYSWDDAADRFEDALLRACRRSDRAAS